MGEISLNLILCLAESIFSRERPKGIQIKKRRYEIRRDLDEISSKSIFSLTGNISIGGGGAAALKFWDILYKKTENNPQGPILTRNLSNNRPILD